VVSAQKKDFTLMQVDLMQVGEKGKQRSMCVMGTGVILRRFGCN